MSVAKRPDGRYRARYRGADGKERAKHFDKRGDAVRWLEIQQGNVARGDWVDPALGRVTIREWAPTWLASKSALKPTSRRSYEELWRTRVEPRWGSVPLSRVTYGDVLTWTASLTGEGLSPSRVGQCLLVLKQLLELAVLDGRLSRNVAKGVKAPRPVRGEQRFLTHEQLALLANECGHVGGDQYRTMVLFSVTPASGGARFEPCASSTSISCDAESKCATESRTDTPRLTLSRRSLIDVAPSLCRPLLLSCLPK